MDVTEKKRFEVEKHGHKLRTSLCRGLVTFDDRATSSFSKGIF
jgi:hypothetical protein